MSWTVIMYEKLKENHKKFYYGVIASLHSNFSQPWRKITENQQKVNVKTIRLLICTLISENQGLEKSRSASNLRKISYPAKLEGLEKKLDL